MSEPAMRRAVRIGDGWVPDQRSSAEIIEAIGRIRCWREEYGRDHLPFDVMAVPSDAFDVDAYRRLEDAGVTHIKTIPWAFYHGQTEGLDKKIDGIRRYADDVISQFD